MSLLIPSFRTQSCPYRRHWAFLESLSRSGIHCTAVTQKICPRYRPPPSISGTKIRCPIHPQTPIA